MSFARNISYQHRPSAHSVIPGIKDGEMDIKKIPSELLLTVKYQRPIDMERVLDIVENFDYNKVDIVKVSDRDGKYYVFDGAHTLSALKKIHKGKTFDVTCRVYHNLTFQQEAELFASQYQRKKKIAFQYELRGHLHAEEPVYEAFEQLTEKCGFKLAVGGNHGPRRIIALKKAWLIYLNYGAEVYEKTLRLIMRTWGGVEWTLFSYMLGGMATFIHKFPEFSEKRFVQKLEQVDLDALQHHIDEDAPTKDRAYAWAIAWFYNVNGGNKIVNADLLKE